MRRAVMWLVVVMFFSAWLCGCAERKTVTIEVKGLDLPEPLKMRDPMINYSWSWQRGWTHFGDSLLGTPIDVAESGHDYVVVYVRVENADSEEIMVSGDDFEMVGSDGKIYSVNPFFSYPSGLRPLFAELMPGGRDSGYVIFEMKT